jgi:hypothetical protein
LNIFKKFTKRQFVIGSVAAAAVATMAGIGSTALFTSTDVSTTYAATGTVDISVTEKVAVTNVLPGVPRSAELVFDNTKSSAPVQMSVSKVHNSSVKGLDNVDWSKFTVEIHDSADKLVYGPVAANKLTAGPVDVVVGANEVWKGRMIWTLDENADDKYQGGAVHTAAVAFTGTQVLPAD